MQVKGFLLFLSVFALQIVSARYTGDPFRHDYKKGMKGFGYSYEHGQLESHKCKAPFGPGFSRKKEIFGDVNVYGGNECLKGRKKPISDGTEVEGPEEGFEGIAEEVPFEGMPETGPEELFEGIFGEGVPGEVPFEGLPETGPEELFEGIFGEGVAEEIGFEGLPETGPEEELFEGIFSEGVAEEIGFEGSSEDNLEEVLSEQEELFEEIFGEDVAEEVPFEGLPETVPEELFEGIAEEVPFEGIPETGSEEELFEGIFGEGVAEEIPFEGLPETGPEELFEDIEEEIPFEGLPETGSEELFEEIEEEVPFEGLPETGPEEELFEDIEEEIPFEGMPETGSEELFEGIFGEGVAEEVPFEGLPETGQEELFEEFPSSEETLEELPSSEIVSKECPRVYDLVYNDTYALNKSDLYEFETLIEDGLEYNYDLDIEWREDEDYVLIRGEGKGKEVASKGGYFIWSNNQQKEVSCEGSESANCTECVDPDCSSDQTLQGNLRGKTFYNYLNEQEHDWNIEFDYMEYEGTIDISKGGSQAHSSEDTFDIDYELFSSSEDEALKDLHSYLNKKEHSDLMSQAKSQIESTSYNQQLKLASFVALIYFL